MSKKNKNRLVHCDFLSIDDSVYDEKMWHKATSFHAKAANEYAEPYDDSACDVTADEDSLGPITNCFGGCKPVKTLEFTEALHEENLNDELSPPLSSDCDTIVQCFGGIREYNTLAHSEMFADTMDEAEEDEQFCFDQHFKHKVAENKFVTLMKELHGLNTKRTRFRGEQRRCLIGITLKPEFQINNMEENYYD